MIDQIMQWLEQVGQNYKFTIQVVNTFTYLIFVIIVIWSLYKIEVRLKWQEFKLSMLEKQLLMLDELVGGKALRQADFTKFLKEMANKEGENDNV